MNKIISLLLLIFLTFRSTVPMGYVQKWVWGEEKPTENIKIGDVTAKQTSKLIKRPNGFAVEYVLFNDKNYKLASFKVFLDNAQSFISSGDIAWTSEGKKFMDLINEWMNQIEDQYKGMKEESEKKPVKIGGFEGKELQKVVMSSQGNFVDNSEYELFDKQGKFLGSIKVFLDKDQIVTHFETRINRDIGALRQVVEQWMQQIKNAQPQKVSE